jgi:hypothetical protein
VAPKAPYLLASFDVDPSNSSAKDIEAEVLAEFPADVQPIPMPVAHLYSIEVPSSQASSRFMEVGMYLSLKDQQHEGVLRWVLQLCRIDEIATG